MPIQELVRELDESGLFRVLKDTHSQINYALNNKFDTGSLKGSDYNKIIVSGLGGSAVGADLIKNFLKDDLKIPLAVNRTYGLPKYADEKTLVIASSYSGNTEETVDALHTADERGCGIVCITTGGKVEEAAEKNGYPIVKLKPGYQPRYALGLNFFDLLMLLQDLELIPDQKVVINRIMEQWKEKGEEYTKEGNAAYSFAEKLFNRVPVIYSAQDVTDAAGGRFKAQLNENSKAHAFHNVYPEMNHNEIIGWETFDSGVFNAVVVNILDEEYHPQIKKRFEIAAELIKDAGAEILPVESRLGSFKERIMDIVFFLDWVSYYLALLNKKDPGEIDFIHHLKKHLS